MFLAKLHNFCIDESDAAICARHINDKQPSDTSNIVMNQNQFDSLVSFVYNVGSGNAVGSSVWKNLRSQKMQMAADSLLLWNKVRKGNLLVPSNGLMSRREAERHLFLEHCE